VPVMRPGQMGPVTRPTERVREPVTAGAPIGPGPGPVPGLGQQPAKVSKDVSERLLATVPLLETYAAQPTASPNFRRFVRLLRQMTRGAARA